MSDEKALPPGEDQGKPDETLEVQSPVQAKGGALQPSADETQSTVLQDPTRRRDTNTASLKRLRPEDFNVSTDGAGDETDQTETVNIKVIKEQKKQFRNMMTSSQTLAVEQENAEQMPAPAQPQEASKATLKIKAPSQETRTESIPRPGAGAAETVAPAPATQAPASPKSTLKIKAPAGMAPAQSGGAAKPGATLKIKAPAAAPAAQADAAQTVQQAAPVRPGKTLKLKPGQAAAAPAAQPQRRKGAATKFSQAPAPAEASASPGIAYTICSVAGVAACIVALIKICTSLSDMFNTVNVFDSRYF